MGGGFTMVQITSKLIRIIKGGVVHPTDTITEEDANMLRSAVNYGYFTEDEKKYVNNIFIVKGLLPLEQVGTGIRNGAFFDLCVRLARGE